MRRVRPAIALATCSLLLLAAPADCLDACPSPPAGGLCVVPALFTDPAALGCLAAADPCVEPTAEQKELLCRLPERPEYQARGGECFTWKPATREACPKAGRYLVWRSAGSDIWVPLDAGTDARQVHLAMTRLKDLLRNTFEGLPSSAYQDVQITNGPIAFDGSQCLPRGFVLGRGSGEGDPERVTPTEFFDDARRFVRVEQETREELETVCQTPEGCDRDAGEATGGEPAPALVPPDPEAPAQDAAAKEAAAQEARERVTAEAAGAEAAGAADADTGGQFTTEADGSGGFLPPGAPPWIADLFDMVLTYFGIKEAVQGAAMALFMLAPDLVYELASLSAGLTKDLANADLDTLFAEVKKLYQIYNTAQSLLSSLEDVAAAADFESAGDLIQSTGKMIESLPPDLQQELWGLVGEDVAKAFGQLQGVTAALDSRMIEGVIDGSARATIAEAVEQKIRDSLTRAVTGALAAELGIDGALLAGSVRALAAGDFEAAGDEALDAASGELGRRLGVPADLVSGVFDGTATEADVAAFATDRAAAAVAEALGVPGMTVADAEALAERLSSGDLSPDQLEVVGRQILGQLDEDARSLAELALEAGRGALAPEERDAALAGALRRLPAPYGELLGSGLSPDAMAAAVIEEHVPGIDDRLAAILGGEDLGDLTAERALAEARRALRARLDGSAFPETTRLLDAGRGGQGDGADASELLATLRRDAESGIRRQLEDAAGGQVIRALDAVELPAAVESAIAALPADPAAARQQLEPLIDQVLARPLTATRGQRIAALAESCLDPGSIAGAPDPLAAARRAVAQVPAGLLGTSPLAWAEHALSRHCGGDPAACAEALCGDLRAAMATRIEALRGYAMLLQRAGRGAAGGAPAQAVPLERALVVAELIDRSPELARQIDPAGLLAAARDGRGGALEAVLGSAMIADLGPGAGAAQLLDRLGGAAGLSPEHLRQAVAGNWQPLARAMTSRLLGEAANWFDAPPEARAARLRRLLEAPPIAARGLSDEGLQACLDGDPACLEDLAVSLPGAAGATIEVADWAELTRQAAERLARALEPKVADVARRAGATCRGVNPRPIAEPDPLPPEIGAGDLQELFRGEIPEIAETVARALLCCPPERRCDAGHLARVARDMAQAQLFTLPAVRRSPELKEFFRDQGQSAEALLAPAVDRAFDALAERAPDLDPGQPLIHAVDHLRAGAARQPPRPPRAGPSAGGTASSAAAARLLATRRCVLVDDGRDGVFCSDPDRWKSDQTCRQRLRECRRAIEGGAR